MPTTHETRLANLDIHIHTTQLTHPSHAPRLAHQLPLLHKQKMHSQISQDDKNAPKSPKTNNIHPQRLNIEAKATQDSRPRNLNIKTILMIHKTQILDFINNQALECIMEDRKLWKY